MSLDLSLLKELPELSANVTLEIRPLAPLSMVSEMPGSYYKSMKCPDKKMICGLFENILGWHYRAQNDAYTKARSRKRG